MKLLVPALLAALAMSAVGSSADARPYFHHHHYFFYHHHHFFHHHHRYY